MLICRCLCSFFNHYVYKGQFPIIEKLGCVTSVFERLLGLKAIFMNIFQSIQYCLSNIRKMEMFSW